MSCPIEIERRALCAAEILLRQAFQSMEEGKSLVRTKKHKDAFSLQMYQFKFRRGTLHQFLFLFSFLSLFPLVSFFLSLFLYIFILFYFFFVLFYKISFLVLSPSLSFWNTKLENIPLISLFFHIIGIQLDGVQLGFVSDSSSVILKMWNQLWAVMQSQHPVKPPPNLHP